MKKITFILVALLFVGFTTAVFAAPPDPGKPGPQAFQKHPGFHRCGSRLNLTPEQRQKMKELRKSFWADTHDLRYDIKMKRVEVRKLFTDPKTEDATLLAKEKELNDLKHQLMDKKAEEKVAWRRILNPEQIQMLDRMHRHHFRHHHGGRWSKGFSRHHHHHEGPMGKGPQAGPGTMGR
jgi:Spy/CpxP family protein refolding chaperone